MYVYFVISEGKPRRMKIGKAKNPHARLKSLQTGSAHKLHLLFTIKCKDEQHSFLVEKCAHEAFAKERKLGEWFKCTDYLMARVMDMYASAPDWEKHA